MSSALGGQQEASAALAQGNEVAAEGCDADGLLRCDMKVSFRETGTNRVDAADVPERSGSSGGNDPLLNRFY